MTFEEKFKVGYDEYLKMPKATINGEHRYAEMYVKKWCILTGRSMIHPHPHRYYTLMEFVFYCGRDEQLYNKFIAPITA